MHAVYSLTISCIIFSNALCDEYQFDSIFLFICKLFKILIYNNLLKTWERDILLSNISQADLFNIVSAIRDN
ncbi:hypothetical protein DCC81_25115 [Chitinophaga parva]|uniref:Uncharacterized protein n=1 Tax=Chitinophaga parva TaxID=2169414 RepID=A0A2T7BBU8_9BACT|nr:hypothetical protein DCC81_25115 [Chitinophaga parva]